MSFYDILLEALKRSGACGSDFLKKVDTGISCDQITQKQELVILALIPFCVGILIVISAASERIGGTSAEIAQSLALLAVFLGGGNRFHCGRKDLFLDRKITADVFVSVSLLATRSKSPYRTSVPAIFFLCGLVGEFRQTESSWRGPERSMRPLLQGK